VDGCECRCSTGTSVQNVKKTVRLHLTTCFSCIAAYSVFIFRFAGPHLIAFESAQKSNLTSVRALCCAGITYLSTPRTLAGHQTMQVLVVFNSNIIILQPLSFFMFVRLILYGQSIISLIALLQTTSITSLNMPRITIPSSTTRTRTCS